MKQFVAIGIVAIAAGVAAIAGWRLGRPDKNMTRTYSPLPGFVGSSSWRNVGTETPGAAFETHCWAITHENPEVLLSTVELAPESVALLNSVFARLGSDQKGTFGNAQRMIGILWVKSGKLPFSSIRIGEQGNDPSGGIALQVKLQYGDQQTSRTYVFNRDATGWRKVSPQAQIAEILFRNGFGPEVK